MPGPLPGAGEVLTATEVAALAGGLAAPPATVAGEDLSEDELRDRLASTEAELHRLQRRRAVRWVDAVRRAQRAGSLREAAGALRELRR